MGPGVCAPIVDTPLFGVPPAPGILSSPLFFLSQQGGRSQDAVLRACAQTDECRCWEMGSCFPSDV